MDQEDTILYMVTKPSKKFKYLALAEDLEWLDPEPDFPNKPKFVRGSILKVASYVFNVLEESKENYFCNQKEYDELCETIKKNKNDKKDITN